jgi:hypothetical protein
LSKKKNVAYPNAFLSWRKMTRKIDWAVLPYDHKGRWKKSIKSILDPNGLVTWPQYIVEMVIWCRKQVFDEYRGIIGKNWSDKIAKQVRQLEYQAAVICNHFPHPEDEPLVVQAFKNHFRRVKPLSIGGYRKNRQNITQYEKDLVLGVRSELEKLRAQKKIHASSPAVAAEEPVKTPQTTSSHTNSPIAPKPKTILEIEKELWQKKAKLTG